MKLVTSAGALLELGPRYRFTTRLQAGPGTALRGTSVVGPVYLTGGGDPLLATGAYARRYLGARATPMGALVRPLRRLGIRRIAGPIVADERVFDARRLGPGWPSDYLSYSSPLSGLSTNQGWAGNARRAHVSSLPIAAAERLRAALRGVRIAHSGGLRAGATPRAAVPLAEVRSRTVAAILRSMNPDSDNFVAEMLTKAVGAHAAGRGTTAAGTARTAAALRARGILDGGDRLVDGSGLSRANRLSATSLVRLIAAADRERAWGAPLIQSMPRGGEGTLARRLRRGPATKRVRAKTGYLGGVSALAGRVVSRRGQRYAFALLMRTGDIAGARATQDRVVSLLAAGAEDLPGGA